MAYLAEIVWPDIRYSHINDMIWRAVKRAQVPIVEESVCFSCADGKRPDGATLIPWASKKALEWHVIVVDTFAHLHIGNASSLAGAAANHAATLKTSKCTNITDTNIFVTVANLTRGAWDQQSIEFIPER